jgi:hypothetical protein
VVGEAGLEPTTPGLEGRCSIQLSYSPVSAIVSLPGAASKLRQANIYEDRQRAIERLPPALIRAVRISAAALDEPAHSKTRNAVNLRVPHDKFHPRRVRRYGA